MALAASAFMLVDGRRIGIRYARLLVVLSFVVVAAFAFPLLLALRHRRLARDDFETDGRVLRALLAVLSVSLIAEMTLIVVQAGAKTIGSHTSALRQRGRRVIRSPRLGDEWTESGRHRAVRRQPGTPSNDWHAHPPAHVNAVH